MTHDDYLIRDIADELRTLDTLWPRIEAELDQAATLAIQHATWFKQDLDDYTRAGVIDSLRAKFEKGEAEHGRDWLNMTSQQLNEEIRAEILDLVIYIAMRRARWRPTSAVDEYLTNRDPGDETGPPVAA